VGSDEVWRNDHVVIEKQNDISGRGGNASIACCGLPCVDLEENPLYIRELPRFSELGGLWIGAITDDDDFARRRIGLTEGDK